MDFDNPTIVFTAANNIESHLVVEMLRANGIEALAVDDLSVVSLWAFGTITQFHKPNVWVDKPDLDTANRLVREFEKQNRERNAPMDMRAPIVVACEKCGKKATFSGDLSGTTQQCSHCYAYIDVGGIGWDEDVGAPEQW